MPQLRIIAGGFMDMVASLPPIKLDKLYDNPFICEAILRSLPPLAKKYVLQMLYFTSPVASKLFEDWILADWLSKHKVAIDRLIQFRIFSEIIDRKKDISYRLNPTFQVNLQKHITLQLHSRSAFPNVSLKISSLEDLDVFALEQWQHFLLRLLSLTETENNLDFSPSMMAIFQQGLVHQRSKESSRLTPKGFQFLLMDTNAQLWYIMREYISNSEERGIDAADLISFLLELSFLVMGQGYEMNILPEFQRRTIRDLAVLGLVKTEQDSKKSLFTPTKLATNLSANLSDTLSRKQGFIVVETNFRMYAYSSSKLHCEILRIFSRIEYQLPNLIVAAITKESLYNAFENGISAEQIITFLQQNAHPRVAERVPSVPENVTDQIRLWESDLNRIEMTSAYLYEDFLSRDVYEAACDFSHESGGLLWEDSQKMRLMVRAEVHPDMREFLRGQKQ